MDDATPVSYFELFRYATAWDIVLMCIGFACTFVKAFGNPVFFIVYGDLTTLLVDRTLGYGTSSPTIVLHLFGGGKILTNATWEENSKEIINDGKAFGILLSLYTTIQFVAGIFAVDCFNQAAIRQVARIRIKYFESMMRQEIGWYDVYGSDNNVAVRLTEDIDKIRDGIAEQVSHFLNLIMGFLICLVMSLIFGWKLTLVMVSYIPIIVITNYIVGRFQAYWSVEEQASYSAAANVAEEVLSGIRTVFAFGGENVEIERYNERLVNAKRVVRMKGLVTGVGDGIMRFLFFAAYALGYWYGAKLVLDDRDKVDKEYTPAVLMVTFCSVVSGGLNISRTGPFLETFATARASASTIFKVIDRPSKIDPMSANGKSSDLEIKGNISFKNVHFNYPSRPEVQILRGFDLEIQTGQSVAIVGHSGNGKSTCLQLLQRFYDPNVGEVLIDGVDTRSMNVNLLRSSIATVGQEPVLFSTTIGENIRHGKPDAVDSEVVAAARNSGAHDFIARLPQGYDTLVGEKGSQLSGGQKQRIAIARALIQNSKILLLDEATSALDYQSEKFIQATLDEASKGRTTITVSHRISAIRSADRIVFIEKGIVVEDGTHSQLMAMKGRYHEMITAGNLCDDGDNMVDTEATTDDYAGSEQQMSSNNKIDEIDRQQVNNSDIECLNSLLTSTIEKMELIVKQQDSFDLVDEKKNAMTKSNGDSIQYWTIFIRTLKLARTERLTMSIATMAALLIGTACPIFAILFGEMYGNLAVADAASVREQTVLLSVIFLATGAMAFFAAVVQTILFFKTSVNLSTRIRAKAFAVMLQQECAWFDEKEHSSSELCTRLTSDASSLQSVIGLPLIALFESISAFLTSVIISMNYSVKLTLVCFTVIPLTFLSVIMESKYMSKMATTEKEALEAGTKIASEAISNIRTVASLRQERHMIQQYANEMVRVEKLIRQKIVWRGLVNSFAQTISLYSYAYGVYYGTCLIADKQITFKNVMIVAEMLVCCSLFIGQALVFAPSFTAAFVGVHRLFQIIDRRSMIKSPEIANKLRKPDIRNDIEYKSIDFSYPTRPDVQILNDFNLKVHEGQTIAMVGSSGCGKSTCIQLLQRLYEPDRGHISVGRDRISTDISLKDLRSKLSIVSQEPVLFDKTIAENIAYGDTTRKVPMDEIIEAAKMANIHDFIVQLPMGYETNVGNKTAQLSGGQKQRIAIARALVRNPNILLLDEATSSLDLQSEQIVQQALDSARSGRTCLIIAHRLSTVQNADVIYVLRGGSIVEHGSHSELLASDGIYARLYNSQKSSSR